MPQPRANTPTPPHPPRLVALELTRRCLLHCLHCRASATPEAPSDELTRDEWFKVLDAIASLGRPIVILSGGEPMLRDDLCDLVAHAAALGLPVAMGTCGVLLDEPAARRLAECGLPAVSVSLDGATAATHDAFRGAAGAFDLAVAGIRAARQARLTVQVNTTLTGDNLPELPAILELAVKMGAATFNPFLLVPTGRGKDLAEKELSPEECEAALVWLAGEQDRKDIDIRVTCAPQYRRILTQRSLAGPRQSTRGCMAGLAFAFVSCRGKVQPCGFLEVQCGDLRTNGYDFAAVWAGSPVLAALRDKARYRGKCGICEFHNICGGCRARAYAASGDYLGDEPLCPHRPVRPASAGRDRQVQLDQTDKQLIWLAQTQFPIAREPFSTLGRQVGISGKEAVERLKHLREGGLIRRIGAVFDAHRLGYVSTLVAARVPPRRLKELADIVSAEPGVTHNYSRRHELNLWFTLTARGQQELERTLDGIRVRSGIGDFYSMPAEEVYKLRAVFPPPGLAIQPDGAAAHEALRAGAGVELGDKQRELARILSGDLPVIERPFDQAARQVGWPVEQVIDQVRAWVADGVIRRLGAVVSHRRLGYVSNAMAAFNAPQDRMDALGRMLAAMPCVSHCYRRRPVEAFNYNLFAMFHGASDQQVQAAVDGFAASAGSTDYQVLMTEREFKKTSPRLFAEGDRRDRLTDPYRSRPGRRPTGGNRSGGTPTA